MMGNVHVTSVTLEINAMNVKTIIMRHRMDAQVPVLWVI